ncbi:ATP-dependent DNA helicase RecG [Leifsonia sp. 98AMF]|uniref:ATP-dependent DNA helicase RecG n=1 Tax=unclassified Leifsonia TaxID=2663824 RepID=UPI00087B6634|nr:MULTISPECIES: ATP-dependent DNA helicase RecG [unclassified Leifsonia]SDH29662.1 ATP-dependent DNA helicase RecG [Leifsonia sp. 197AMF]SDJ07638.1 ATP-dependent DNA helicase RecG [Leifsonia sp. 466MF]SDJ63644.1 ATP-dependent DNA helicase RecG [Leifsonia sp. 157MF]SDN28566.1 ATP-dependent DNA helicase RecG [Leifsonia sp. 509MF]SEM92489.1 ATP-dependent DNA helicase RecG [Leifsonia sp. 467MF]
MTSVPAPAGSGSADAGTVGLDTRLSGVLGGRTASAFEKAFGMRTVADLLSHFPRRYAKRGELTALANLPLDENVTIIAEVLRVQERPMRARRGSILEVKISDGEGILTLTFFNQAWRSRELLPGVRGIFAGKVSAYRGALQLAHPDYELFEPDAENAVSPGSAAAKDWAQTPIPIYPATGTVASWQVQKAVGLALDALGPVPDPVPDAIVVERGLVPYRDALEGIHRPQKDAQWQRARDTLRFQEAFVLQAALLQQRAASREAAATPRVAVPGGLLERFDAALPFALTGDQDVVGGEIARDLADTAAMHRLVQGEVGSGKTLVALRAMLAVADSGGQSALLAPTEVLAAQHVRSIAAMLGPDLSAQLMPTLLTGQLSAAERKRALLRTVSGQARIVVGTHALLGDAVTFFDLGLVVVDEQHRFGVEQREALRAKGGTPPHVLVLTATPIPRTVAMTVFGDLDVSTIAQLPAGRQGIESFVVPLADRPGWERRIWERASEEIAKGRQVFVVCPAISGKDAEDDGEEPEPDEPEGDGAPPRPIANVESVAAQVRADPLFAGTRIGVLHGRLPSDEKDEVMRAFAGGDIDLLIATTVIEVGVNVPNASAMVVLDADRFGVSQLHQLRGRVGRGDIPGLCLLVTAAEQGSLARERVEAVAATLDGFELANIDLELRREGDVLGSRQSGGRSSLRLLRVATDGELISEARVAAEETLEADPSLAAHPALAAALARRLDESERAFLGKS